eukprot:3766731-Rhodomonas_salina.3
MSGGTVSRIRFGTDRSNTVRIRGTEDGRRSATMGSSASCEQDDGVLGCCTSGTGAEQDHFKSTPRKQAPKRESLPACLWA